MSKIDDFLQKNGEVISHKNFEYFFNSVSASHPDYVSFKEIFPRTPFRIRSVHSIGKGVKRYELYTNRNYFSLSVIEFILGKDFYIFIGDDRYFNINKDIFNPFFSSSYSVVSNSLREKYSAWNHIYKYSYSNSRNITFALLVNLMNDSLKDISEINISDFEEYLQRAKRISRKFESVDIDKQVSYLFKYSGVQIFKKFSFRKDEDFDFLFDFLKICLNS